MLALCANNRKCPCHRPYDPHADHVNTCIHCKHLSIQAHNHFQDSLVSLARDAGCVGVNTNRVPTIAVAQDQHFRADIYIPQMLLVACRGVCLDASRVHDFRGSADNPSQNGTLRHSDINLSSPSGYRRRLTSIGRATRPKGCVTPSSLRSSPRLAASTENCSGCCTSLLTRRLSFTSRPWVRPSMVDS